MTDFTVTEIKPPAIVAEGAPVADGAFGGSMEGASRISREMARWSPSFGSPDSIISRGKPLADARGRDIQQNDGYARGAVSIHQDSIVGSQYMLTCEPNITVLNSGSNAGRSAPKFDETWADEMSEIVEARMNIMAESEDCWLDAARQLTFTGQVRLAVGGYVWTGEVLASGEWIRQAQRPIKTAFQMISPSRLCNKNLLPNGPVMGSNGWTKSGGVTKDSNGQAIFYDIRQGYPSDGGLRGMTWDIVASRKPWGRRQIIHIMEPREPGQTRGIADMVSVLKQMRMTKNHADITLQNAVVQASYAAAIESELPPDAIKAMMGGDSGPQNFNIALSSYMGAMAAYIGEANGISIDGVKIPHLFPGTKLNTKQLGSPGGAGYTDYETSLLRHIAAALGIGYEEFARDFSRVSYSSARASMNTTGRFMRARKKMVADRFATQAFQMVFEEELSAGNIPLPRGVSPEYFYVPLMKDAFTACTWTGSGVGQIDELKETQAALLRIQGGLSSYQSEIGRFGKDYRKVFRQRAKENTLMDSLSLEFNLATKKPLPGGSEDAGPTNAADNEDPQPDPKEQGQTK